MNNNIEHYDFPKDLKKMSTNELDLLSYSIRDFLINKVSKTGGHLASNLGVVELTIAIHKFFNCPEDKVIWDVGHQSYVHKILTGRAKDFDTLRQLDGLSGFPKGKESPYDAFDTGHSSTSISVAAGFAAARDIKHEHNDVVAVIGDGSLTGGMAYEALNNVGASKSKVIVILNDNGMSISKNIGGVSQHLGNLRTSKEYLSTKAAVKNAIGKIPLVGENLSEGIAHAKEKVKYAILSGGVIFEELGFTYLGPVDGHNISALLENFKLAEQANGPVLIHVITKKGKGYRNAEIEPNKFHGIGAFNPETGVALSTSKVSYSNVFGNSISKLAETNDKIVAITAAMCDATGLKDFSIKYPRRYFDVGIAEAHGVSFAAGLAKEGLRPVFAVYSSFLQRGYDQILEDVCIQNLPVIFAIDRAGIVGADGETHHGVFDISYLSSLPNMTILTPSDGNQLEAMLKYALTQQGPVAIRYPRGECHYSESKAFNFDGKNIRVLEGKDVDIWAAGKMMEQAVNVVEILKDKGISAGLVNVTTVKPMDISPYDDSKLIFTLEDNVILGGFGEKLRGKLENCEVINLGWPDKFIEHGKPEELFDRYGLDAVSIAERICEHLEGKA